MLYITYKAQFGGATLLKQIASDLGAGELPPGSRLEADKNHATLIVGDRMWTWDVSDYHVRYIGPFVGFQDTPDRLVCVEVTEVYSPAGLTLEGPDAYAKWGLFEAALETLNIGQVDNLGRRPLPGGWHILQKHEEPPFGGPMITYYRLVSPEGLGVWIWPAEWPLKSHLGIPGCKFQFANGADWRAWLGKWGHYRIAVMRGLGLYAVDKGGTPVASCYTRYLSRRDLESEAPQTVFDYSASF